MPNTMLNWKKPTRRPRALAGAISAMYMGPSTEEAPIPSPPMNRASTNEFQSNANAQPSAEMTYSTAVIRRLARRPYLSPGTPPNMDPRMVPYRAAATVSPSDQSVSAKVLRKAPVAPEITAVSNPKSSPPSAATTELLARYALIFMGRSHPDRLQSAAKGVTHGNYGSTLISTRCVHVEQRFSRPKRFFEIRERHRRHVRRGHIGIRGQVRQQVERRPRDRRQRPHQHRRDRLRRARGLRWPGVRGVRAKK